MNLKLNSPKLSAMSRTIYLLSFLFILAFSGSCQRPGSTGSAGQGEVINTSLPVNDYEKLMSDKKDFQLVDVRTPGEFQGGHLQNAVNIDYRGSDFSDRISQLDKSKPTFVYCLSGGRSSSAASAMKEMGFREVYNMDGGIMKWNAAGKPLATAEGQPVSMGMTLSEFNQKVTSDKYVLVDFNAAWCAPCQKMKPYLKEIAEQKKEKLMMMDVNADANKALLKEKGIDGIPYLELYKDGKLIWKHSGFIEKSVFLEETKL